MIDIDSRVQKFAADAESLGYKIEAITLCSGEQAFNVLTADGEWPVRTGGRVWPTVILVEDAVLAQNPARFLLDVVQAAHRNKSRELRLKA